MTKQTHIDYLQSYCNQLQIKEGGYLSTFTAPHLQGQEQKNYLLNQIELLDECISVFEWNYSPNTKGWHLHVLSNKPIQSANDNTQIYDLNNLLVYLSKQVEQLAEPIRYNAPATIQKKESNQLAEPTEINAPALAKNEIEQLDEPTQVNRLFKYLNIWFRNLELFKRKPILWNDT